MLKLPFNLTFWDTLDLDFFKCEDAFQLLTGPEHFSDRSNNTWMDSVWVCGCFVLFCFVLNYNVFYKRGSNLSSQPPFKTKCFQDSGNTKTCYRITLLTNFYCVSVKIMQCYISKLWVYIKILLETPSHWCPK